MEKPKRKARDSKVPDSKLMHPIDVTKFGSKDDPCFGKLYSLTEDECLYCGDNELCSIAFMNQANRKRLAHENKVPTLDIEIDVLEKEKDIIDFIAELKGKGFKPLLIKRRLKQRFRMSDDKLTQYCKNGC